MFEIFINFMQKLCSSSFKGYRFIYTRIMITKQSLFIGTINLKVNSAPYPFSFTRDAFDVGLISIIMPLM
jgi:hypothetical protein